MHRFLTALGFCLVSVPAAWPQNDPEARQAPREYTVEKLTWGYRAVAGPVWSSEGHLLFCDVPNGKVYKWAPGQKTQPFLDNPGRLSALEFDDKGRLFAAAPGARQVLRFTTKGEPEPFVTSFEGKPLNAPHDLAVRKDGHVFFVDPAFGAQDDKKDLPFYGVYHATPRGELQILARYDKRPGGIALSPNGRTLYVSGADERVVRAWDLDRSGKATNERILVTGVEGVPMGLEIDGKGNLWVAAGQLFRYSPEGKLLRSIPLPEPPSNVALQDPEGSVIYVTARSTVYRVLVDGTRGEEKAQR